MQRLLIFLFLVLAIISCGKDKLGYPIWEAGNTTNGFCEGFRNGKSWDGAALGFNNVQTQFGKPIDSLFNLYFNTFLIDGVDTFIREEIAIGPFPRKAGKYQIYDIPTSFSANAYYSLLLGDGDSGGMPSYLSKFEGKYSEIQIASYNKMTDEVEGSFEVSFFFNLSGEPFYDLPKYVTFSEMKFKAKVID